MDGQSHNTGRAQRRHCRKGEQIAYCLFLSILRCLIVQIARQVVTLQYLLELASSLKANPQSPSLIEGFFRKYDFIHFM
jgi:hypothetical protein